MYRFLSHPDFTPLTSHPWASRLHQPLSVLRIPSLLLRTISLLHECRARDGESHSASAQSLSSPAGHVPALAGPSPERPWQQNERQLYNSDSQPKCSMHSNERQRPAKRSIHPLGHITSLKGWT